MEINIKPASAGFFMSGACMTTYSTNNPLGSTDPRDLYDNSQNFDHLSIDMENELWPDRKGISRLTWFGMEKRYNDKLAAMGWALLDSFQGGATLTRPDQALRWKLPDGDGEYYRWDGDFGSSGKIIPVGSTPSTTGGIGPGAWVGVGDASLRSQILATQPGATNLNGMFLRFTPVAYGALANGGDDTSHFTACMAAMPSGATLDLQGLTYSVTDIEVTKPMRIINGTINVLYGSVKGGIWVHDTHDVRVDNVNANVDYLNKSLYTAENVSGVIFENCTNVTATNINAIGSKCNTYLPTGSWGCPIHAYQCDGVVLHNCKGSHSDKEGIMTRLCDNVKMGMIHAEDCGYSGVGTSGGNGLIACNIWSYRSGKTNCSFNSTNFVIAGIYSEGNLDEGGVCLGHNHEVAQYTGSGTASGITIINSAKSGLVIGKHKNITLDGVTVDTCGTVTAGAGIVINDAMEGNCNVLVGNINLKNITGTGINYLYNGNTNLTIDGGVIQGCTLNAIQAQHNGFTNIKNVTFRGNAYDIAVFPYASDGTQKMTALNVQNCDMEFTTNWNVVFRGIQHVKFDGIAALGFNSGNTSTMASIRCDTIVGSTFELPDSIEFNNSRFNGTVGSGVSATIVIGDDGLTTTGKRLKVNGCHFGDTTKKPIQYTAARMAMQWGRNTRGTDTGLQTVSIPSSGSVVVNNSNITTEGMPVMVARGNSGFYISSWALGTMTINNTGATSINLTIQH